MAIDTRTIQANELKILLLVEEGHFSDAKSCDIAPAKLTKTIAAFSNAEGGELYIGLDENKSSGRFAWRGFKKVEDANGHLQILEKLFPLGDGYTYVFLQTSNRPGLVLKVEVAKSREIKKASDEKIYLRRGAQNLPVTTAEGIERLKRNKGLSSFETETLNVSTETIVNSDVTKKVVAAIVPAADPYSWLKKQQLIVEEKPTVAGIMLFADEPQAILPKRSGIKVYRYKTTAPEGTRDSLAEDPISIEGCAYQQISESVKKTSEIIESVRINTPEGLAEAKYPATALHEIITNAVLHRDYSLADDIHIRIFDNRVEVVSPGSLPAHITPENILDERFARNAAIVRLINKFPNPPNKDVGEGLNTAFTAMREMKLKPPAIEQASNSVRVILRHESLASPEEIILEYLARNPSIRNRIARELCFIGSENRIKVILQRMVRKGLIELVPGTTRYSAAYRLKQAKTAK